MRLPVSTHFMSQDLLGSCGAAPVTILARVLAWGIIPHALVLGKALHISPPWPCFFSFFYSRKNLRWEAWRGCKAHWGASKDPGSKAWRERCLAFIYWIGIQHSSFTPDSWWVKSHRSPRECLSFLEGHEREFGLYFSLVLTSITSLVCL